MTEAKNKITDAWRTEQARALVCSSALKAACTNLEIVWAQLTREAEAKGLGKDRFPDRVNVAVEIVESVEVVLRDFGGDVSAMLTPWHDEGLTSDAVVAMVVANLAGLLPKDAYTHADLLKLGMALEGVAKSIVDVLTKCRIELAPANFTNIVCNIALPLLDAYLMVKAMNMDWTLEFPQAGALYNPSTMTDDDNELEWRLNDDDE
ncbi:hypothetical protein AMAG_19789, partial [Allomyces macrogynus ATCC 38327]